MGARPAATPRPGDDRGTSPDGSPEDKHRSPVGLTRADLPFAEPVAAVETASLDLSEFSFSETAPEFQVELEVDPIDAEAEEAAMLFANGQDGAVRSLLEKSARAYPSGPGERLWLMLFDLFRLTGQKAAFEALGIEYAGAFEKSPPGWPEAIGAELAPATVPGKVLFKGELTGDNDSGFNSLRQAIDRTPLLRADLSKVRQLDADGCERLLTLLQAAKKKGREVELLGHDYLSSLLDDRVLPGRAEDQACWLLKLEFCQLLGQLEVFEEVAIDYAVTFEISPPSWEARKVLAAAAKPLVLAPVDDIASEGYVIKGDVRGSRFGDLLVYAAATDPVLIDCSAVTRMDFLSAGALLNILTTVKRTGRQIVFHHPHYLLAELFRVVGLKAVAEIVPARN